MAVFYGRLFPLFFSGQFISLLQGLYGISIMYITIFYEGGSAMYNKNISWEHIVKAVVSILFLMGILTGCGRLQSSFAVKANIKQALPHAVILDVENGTRSEKYKFKKKSDRSHVVL